MVHRLIILLPARSWYAKNRAKTCRRPVGTPRTLFARGRRVGPLANKDGVPTLLFICLTNHVSNHLKVAYRRRGVAKTEFLFNSSNLLAGKNKVTTPLYLVPNDLPINVSHRITSLPIQGAYHVYSQNRGYCFAFAHGARWNRRCYVCRPHSHPVRRSSVRISSLNRWLVTTVVSVISNVFRTIHVAPNLSSLTTTGAFSASVFIAEVTAVALTPTTIEACMFVRTIGVVSGSLIPCSCRL